MIDKKFFFSNEQSASSPVAMASENILEFKESPPIFLGGVNLILVFSYLLFGTWHIKYVSKDDANISSGANVHLDIPLESFAFTGRQFSFPLPCMAMKKYHGLIFESSSLGGIKVTAYLSIENKKFIIGTKDTL